MAASSPADDAIARSQHLRSSCRGGSRGEPRVVWMAARRATPCSSLWHLSLPWAALVGLVLPRATAPRPGFAPSCASGWAPAFQAPKDDVAAALSRAQAARELLLPRQRPNRPAAVATAAAARLPAVRQTLRKRGAPEAAESGRGVTMRARAGRGLSDTSEAPMHVTEQGLDALEMPSALAQWVDRLPKDLLQIIDTIEGETGGRAWLVGGCIRDCLCGLTPWEVDMATTLRPEQVLALFPRALDTGSSHGTVTVRKGGVSCEVTTLRAEAEHGLDGSFALSAGSVEASGVRFGTSLKHDLEQRDLTINSMAVHVASRHLFDPAGGRHDIETKTLRAVGNAQQRLSEDALRALRAYRWSRLVWPCSDAC